MKIDEQWKSVVEIDEQREFFVYPIGDKTKAGTRVGDRKTRVVTACPQGR